MKKFLPNVSPLTFSGSAIIVGYLLIDDFSATQQEAISSWLGLVSDVLSANAAWLAVIEERQEFIKTSQKEPDDSTNGKKDDDKDHQKPEDELELILQTLEKMKKDIQNLKNQKQD